MYNGDVSNEIELQVVPAVRSRRKVLAYLVAWPCLFLRTPVGLSPEGWYTVHATPR